MAAPRIHTYHCLCTTLLLATTHNLSSLPRRSPPNLDNAIILPQTALPISTEDDLDSGTTADLPAEGYSVLSGMQRDPVSRTTVVRREDGFERRVLWRCGRCRLVVGYEIEGEDGMDGSEKGKGKEREQVVYLLPGGILSTEAMAAGKKIGEVDVEIGTGKGVGVWET